MTAAPVTTVTAESLTVPGADGTPLAATLVRPASGRRPAVLIRTPYGRENLLAEARGWAAHGFACLVADVRGRGGSAGEFRPYAHEADDGAAVLRVLRQLPGCDGRVVLAGASYGAHCAVATALVSAAPSADGPDVCGVLAAVPALGRGETVREPGGATRLACRIGWWSEHGQGARPGPAGPDPSALPVRRAVPGDPPGWSELWDAPAEDPRLWAGIDAARVPLLAIGGTADPFAARTAELARRWGGPSQLVLGPWGHELDAGAPGAVLAGRRIGALYAAWATAAVDGRLRRRGAVVAAGGSGRWVRSAAATDLEIRAQVLGDGVFVADPDRPVRSRPPGAPAPGPGTPAGDRALARTPGLPTGTLAGPLVVRLVGDSDARDADWVVRVGLRGTDLVTAVHRHRVPAARSAPPGPVRHDVVVRTPPVGVELAAGDRLTVEVAGHHWPAHARNPHTGEDAAVATVLRPDRRRLRTLDLVLPHLVPGRGDVAAAAIPEEVSR